MDSIDHPRLSYAISMIAVNVAVKSALQFMNQLLTGYMDIKLEEVEISDDEKFWNITLSAIPPPPEEGPSQSPLATMFKPKTKWRKWPTRALSKGASNGSALNLR